MWQDYNRQMNFPAVEGKYRILPAAITSGAVLNIAGKGVLNRKCGRSIIIDGRENTKMNRLVKIWRKLWNE